MDENSLSKEIIGAAIEVVQGLVVVELKAVERLLPIHHAQVLTYLKLLSVKLGLWLNFNVPLLKEGIHRIALCL